MTGKVWEKLKIRRKENRKCQSSYIKCGHENVFRAFYLFIYLFPQGASSHFGISINLIASAILGTQKIIFSCTENMEKGYFSSQSSKAMQQCSFVLCDYPTEDTTETRWSSKRTCLLMRHMLCTTEKCSFHSRMFAKQLDILLINLL